MQLTSLRSKIFLFVGATLLLSAVAVMLIAQRDVTRSIVASEEHAVANVLNLLLSDSEARWGALLTDKITTVRNSRQQLIQQGLTLRSVLERIRGQSQSGLITDSEARTLAQDWLNGLRMDKHRYAYVFDAQLQVLASGDPMHIDKDLSHVQDFKGRPMARAAYDEARSSGQSFAIYRWPGQADAAASLHYAYFFYFAPWDWVVAITDDARGISEQFAQRRDEMETALREALSELRLAQSGFAFIIADDDSLVAPLPPGQEGLLTAADANRGLSLTALLEDVPTTGEVQTFAFEPEGRTTNWQISAAHFKPLGWTIVAAVPAEDLTRAANSLRNRLALTFLAVLAASLLLAWALSKRITQPLQQLTDYARVLPEQDLRTPAPIPDYIESLPRRQPDEVGRLAATFMYMDAQLRQNVQKLLEETTSRQRFESELNIARDIQMGLLPLPLPSAILERVDLHAAMQPAKQVGGDLYDYFVLNDGRLCLAIGDVSDKGVPAALFMAVTRTVIRASAEECTDPAEIMSRVNNRLAETNPNLMFVTLIIAVLDTGTGDFVWANAGHPPPCLIQADGRFELLEGRSGPACGVQEELPYRSFQRRLSEGDLVLAYTDGVSEALNEDGALYGEVRLYAELKHAAQYGPKGCIEKLIADVETFAGDAEQSDDITLIAFRKVST